MLQARPAKVAAWSQFLLLMFSSDPPPNILTIKEQVGHGVNYRYAVHYKNTTATRSSINTKPDNQDSIHMTKRKQKSKGEWWHTDSRGRKIGYMWPEDMLAIIESIWGIRKGIGGFARYAGYTNSTVEGYCNGNKPIPLHIALLVEYMQYDAISIQKKRNPRPWEHLKSVDAPWLPGELDTTFGVLDDMPLG